MHQKITYEQYLPLLIGEPLDLYKGYDITVDPSIDLFFTNLAFLYGHAATNSIIYRLNEDLTQVDKGHMLLRESMDAVEPIIEYGPGPYLRGMHFQRERDIDLHVVEDLRNRFPLKTPSGFDIVASGVQRNREAKTARYNEARRAFNLPEVTEWDQLSPDPDIQNLFKESYKNISLVETYFAAFAEKHEKGVTGPLMGLSFKEQFQRLRDGDPYFYKRPGHLTEQEELDLRDMTFGTLIKLNTDIKNFPNNPFFTDTVDPEQESDEDRAQSQSVSVTPDFTVGWEILRDGKNIDFSIKTTFGVRWFAFALGETMNNLTRIFLFKPVSDAGSEYICHDGYR